MNPFAYEINKANKKPNKLVHSIVPGYLGGDSLPHEHDYDSFIKAYKSWVYIACSKNAVAVASQPLRLFFANDSKSKVRGYKTRELDRIEFDFLTKDNSANIKSLPSVKKAIRIEEVLEHPFLDLIHSVNNFMNMFDLFELTTLHEDLTGQGYWYILDNKLGIPKEIWPIMPQELQVIPDDKKFISGYKYSKNGLFEKSSEVIFQEKEIIHFKHISPKSYYYGYSPIWAVRDAYNLSSEMYTYEKALFENGGTLSGTFQTEADLNEFEFDRLKHEIKEMFTGANNAGKAPLLSNGVKYNPYGLPPKEMSFLKGRASLKEEVCFVPETKIIMSNGIKNIEDINVGDKVLTHNGRFRKVLKTFKRKYEGDLVYLRTKSLDNVLVTPNHPAFVFESKCERYSGVTNASIVTDSEPVWKQVGDINTRELRNDGKHYKDSDFDNLALPILSSGNRTSIDISTFCDSELIYNGSKIKVDNYNSKEVNRLIPLDYEFGRLIGYFLSEGSTGQHQTMFYFHQDENEYRNDVVSTIESHFGSTCSLADKTEHKVIAVRNSNKIIRDFFAQFGHNAQDKKMPEWIFEAQDPKFWMGIVEGIINGDGCFYKKRNMFKLVSTSKHLIWQIRLLLMTIRKNSSFVIKENHSEINGKKCVCQPLYMLSFANGDNRSCAKEFDNHFAYIVQDKEYSRYNGFVYNIEVEEDNSYVTTGGIFHNCNALGQNLAMYSQEANRANADAAFAEFARNAVRPRLKKIEQKINEKLMPRYDGRLFVMFDNPVPEDKAFILEERVKNVQTGITSINYEREKLHLPPVAGLEKPIIPVNYQTVEMLIAGANPVSSKIAEASAKAIEAILSSK